MSTTRDCDCDHGYPLCCCALEITGDDLLRCSLLASSIAGYPSTNLDPDAVQAHNDRMARVAELRANEVAAMAEEQSLRESQPTKGG